MQRRLHPLRSKTGAEATLPTGPATLTGTRKSETSGMTGSRRRTPAGRCRGSATSDAVALRAAEVDVIEPIVVDLGLDGPRVPAKRRGELEVIKPPLLHHLEVRVIPVQHPVHPPLENPVRARAGRVLHIELDAMPLTQRHHGRGHVGLVAQPGAR